MKLTAEILDRFKSGRFEEFLDDGAAQLQRRFPARFEAFPTHAEALDAGRNVVGLSYECACEMGRRSGLLAMRIAFLRAAWGIGVLEDPRYPELRQIVEAQTSARAASIEDNTAIGRHLSESRALWEAEPLMRGREGRLRLCGKRGIDRIDWPAILDHLKAAHAEAETGIGAVELERFVHQCYADAMTLGFATPEGVQLHVIAADLFGIHFYDDPFLPRWGARYRAGPERAVVDALRGALVTRGG